MNTSDKRLELKECPECKGAVMQHFDTCPHCGACQSKNCIEKEKMLREKAVELKKRLERAAEIFEKLEANGWELTESYGAVYSLDFYKNISEKQAKQELQKMGIDPEEVNIREIEEEWEEMEE